MRKGEFITTRQAAERTGYGRRYIAKLCRDGKLEGAVRVAGKYGHTDWLVPLKAVLRYSPEIRPGAHPHKKKAGA